MAPCPGVIGSKCVSFSGVVWVKRQKTQIWAEVPVEISHLQSWLKTRSQKGVVPSIQTERERERLGARTAERFSWPGENGRRSKVERTDLSGLRTGTDILGTEALL